MANVDISINSHLYTVSCEAGQEERVQVLAKYVESQLSRIKSTKSSSEAHLIVLTSLLLADEVADLKNELTNGKAASNSPAEQEKWQHSMTTLIDQTTKRIEGLAKDFEAR